MNTEYSVTPKINSTKVRTTMHKWCKERGLRYYIDYRVVVVSFDGHIVQWQFIQESDAMMFKLQFC